MHSGGVSMTDFSRLVLQQFQIRKKRKQKTAFIDLIKSYYSDAIIEEGGFGKNRNIVIGNVDTAKVIFTAHYDTCAQLPFPNLIFPKNIFLTILYSVLIVVPFFAVLFPVHLGILYLTESFLLAYYTYMLLLMVLVISVFYGGKPNIHTANDNTSGVVTLIETIAKLTPEQRSKCAFVFFDNEENGLLGSAFFRKTHKAVMNNKLIVNVDCVGDGDHILFVSNKKARKYFGDAFYSSFKCENGKNIRFEKNTNTFYPSDQMGFPVNIAVASLKKKPVVGYYLDKIHTKKDIYCDETNIEIISSGFAEFISKI